MNSIKDILNSKKFKHLEQYNLGDALIIESFSQFLGQKFSYKNTLKQLFKAIFLKREFCYELPENANIFMFYSNIAYRQDHFNTLYSFYKALDNPNIAIMYPDMQKSKFNSLGDIFRNISLVSSWYRTLKDVKMWFPKKTSIVVKIAHCYNMIQLVSNLKGDYSLVVSFFDVCPQDNIVIQYFKSKGIKTCTLQHGAFRRPLKNPKKIDETGVEYIGSSADYFATWNNFLKEQAIKSGVPSEKVKVLGPIKNIDKNNDALEYAINMDKKYFGVILNTHQNDDQNRELIARANELAQQQNLKYYVKYHPNYKGDEYDDIIEKDVCAGVVDKSKTISAYAQLVDFSLVTVSTVYIELISLKKPVFRYRFSDLDIYADILQNSFETTAELIDLLKQPTVLMDNMKQLYRDFNTVKNPKVAYNEFMNGFEKRL